MSDERIRDLYQADLEQGSVGDRSSCPPAERLEALVEGTLPETERLRELDHVMGCAECLRDFELLRAIQEASASRRPTRSRIPLALAASLVGLVAAGTVWQLTRSADPVFRGDGDLGVRVLAPVGSVPTVDEIRWTRAQGEVQYNVEILDERGSVVYGGSTADTFLALPAGTELDSGEAYRLILEVVSLETGRVSLPTTGFRIR